MVGVDTTLNRMEDAVADKRDGEKDESEANDDDNVAELTAASAAFMKATTAADAPAAPMAVRILAHIQLG